MFYSKAPLNFNTTVKSTLLEALLCFWHLTRNLFQKIDLWFPLIIFSCWVLCLHFVHLDKSMFSSLNTNHFSTKKKKTYRNKSESPFRHLFKSSFSKLLKGIYSLSAGRLNAENLVCHLTPTVNFVQGRNSSELSLRHYLTLQCQVLGQMWPHNSVITLVQYIYIFFFSTFRGLYNQGAATQIKKFCV